MKINFNHLLWLTPFASFLIGYAIMASFFKPQHIETPALVGKTIVDAVRIASKHDLSLRISAEKDDSDLPDGTIISQTPSAQTIIKARQAIYIVLSKKPALEQTPNLLQKSASEIAEIAQKKGIQVKTYQLPSSNTPANCCIAQTPAPGTPLERKNMAVYLCNDTLKPVIMPNFKGQLLPDVQEFLQLHGITPSIIYTNPLGQAAPLQQNIVVDQRPLPGTLVTLSPEKPLLIQLQVTNT